MLLQTRVGVTGARCNRADLAVWAGGYLLLCCLAKFVRELSFFTAKFLELLLALVMGLGILLEPDIEHLVDSLHVLCPRGERLSVLRRELGDSGAHGYKLR